MMRIYCDTSVFGGCFDIEFRIWSQALMHDIILEKYRLLVSDIAIAELEKGPDQIKNVLRQFSKKQVELVSLDDESRALATAYINQGIVSSRFLVDCQHIALATIHLADILVSWNFKHMVNYNRIRLYNMVNLKLGYHILEIRSPRDLAQ